MSKLDVRWMLAHPLRWATAVGFQLFVSALLLGKAILITNPIWEVTRWSHLGPITIAAAAGVTFASAVAPADRRLQIATTYTLLGVAAWRIFTYAMLIATGPSATAVVLCEAFILHWAWVGATATRWSVISTKAALVVTVEAGRDQGPLRAAG